MPSYLVETFLARSRTREWDAQEQRARSAAEELTAHGTAIRFDGSIHVPEDEVCFFVFEAPSAPDAAFAARQAGLETLRVVEAVTSRKENT